MLKAETQALCSVTQLQILSGSSASWCYILSCLSGGQLKSLFMFKTLTLLWHTVIQVQAVWIRVCIICYWTHSFVLGVFLKKKQNKTKKTKKEEIVHSISIKTPDLQRAAFQRVYTVEPTTLFAEIIRNPSKIFCSHCTFREINNKLVLTGFHSALLQKARS